MELLSIRAYGKRVGKSYESVRNWIKAGMPTGADGKIEPVAADAWRAANLEAHVEEPGPAGSEHLTGERVEHRQTEENSTLSGVSGLTAARTEREEIKARREAIKLGFEERELVPVAETEQAWGELVATAKDRLMILPGKLASRLAAVSDELQVHSILEREITSALSELSRSCQGEDVYKK